MNTTSTAESQLDCLALPQQLAVADTHPAPYRIDENAECEALLGHIHTLWDQHQPEASIAQEAQTFAPEQFNTVSTGNEDYTGHFPGSTNDVDAASSSQVGQASNLANLFDGSSDSATALDTAHEQDITNQQCLEAQPQSTPRPLRESRRRAKRTAWEDEEFVLRPSKKRAQRTK